VTRAIVFLARRWASAWWPKGIETADQLAQLCALGCESGQGFHLSTALPGPE